MNSEELGTELATLVNDPSTPAAYLGKNWAMGLFAVLALICRALVQMLRIMEAEEARQVVDKIKLAD